MSRREQIIEAVGKWAYETAPPVLAVEVWVRGAEQWFDYHEGWEDALG